MSKNNLWIKQPLAVYTANDENADNGIVVEQITGKIVELVARVAKGGRHELEMLLDGLTDCCHGGARIGHLRGVRRQESGRSPIEAAGLLAEGAEQRARSFATKQSSTHAFRVTRN